MIIIVTSITIMECQPWVSLRNVGTSVHGSPLTFSRLYVQPFSRFLCYSSISLAGEKVQWGQKWRVSLEFLEWYAPFWGFLFLHFHVYYTVYRSWYICTIRSISKNWGVSNINPVVRFSSKEGNRNTRVHFWIIEHLKCTPSTCRCTYMYHTLYYYHDMQKKPGYKLFGHQSGCATRCQDGESGDLFRPPTHSWSAFLNPNTHEEFLSFS